MRAAAVFLHEAAVLLHRVEGDRFWTLPGGRVQPAEDSATTLVREMREELNEAVVCERLLYLVENFFTHQGMRIHELGFYYLASLSPNARLLDKTKPHTGVEDHPKLEFVWFDLSHLGQTDVRPAFLQKSLVEPLLPFQHMVQRV